MGVAVGHGDLESIRCIIMADEVLLLNVTDPAAVQQVGAARCSAGYCWAGVPTQLSPLSLLLRRLKNCLQRRLLLGVFETSQKHPQKSSAAAVTAGRACPLNSLPSRFFFAIMSSCHHQAPLLCLSTPSPPSPQFKQALQRRLLLGMAAPSDFRVLWGTERPGENGFTLDAPNASIQRREISSEDMFSGSGSTAEEDDLPFEFKALELALELSCSGLDRQAQELAQEAYPLLERLAFQISTTNLELVRRIKSSLLGLTRFPSLLPSPLEHLRRIKRILLGLTRRVQKVPSPALSPALGQRVFFHPQMGVRKRYCFAHPPAALSPLELVRRIKSILLGLTRRVQKVTPPALPNARLKKGVADRPPSLPSRVGALHLSPSAPAGPLSSRAEGITFRPLPPLSMPHSRVQNVSSPTLSTFPSPFEAPQNSRYCFRTLSHSSCLCACELPFVTSTPVIPPCPATHCWPHLPHLGKVRDEIEQLMDDDGDTAEMCLTQKPIVTPSHPFAPLLTPSHPFSPPVTPVTTTYLWPPPVRDEKEQLMNDDGDMAEMYLTQKRIVRDEIEQLMDDDGDMAEMYLTQKRLLAEERSESERLGGAPG
ncbi:unnamed protein product [Closterium sp. NIES-65]|nr:unnamed protein product [Closterium sp. NIES-65]